MSKDLVVMQNKLTPDVWQMLMSVADASFESRQFGIARQGEAAVKVLFCYENNLPLTAANTGLYIVNKKLAVQSNIIAAKFRQHPDYDYKIKTLTDDCCEIEVLRRNHEGEFEVVYTSKFDKEDAKQAGLLVKDNWKNYPRNMYFGRALTNGYRWAAPDLFSQPIYIPEELGMKVDSEGSPIIEGEFSVEDEPEMTLKDLQEKFAIADILKANGGNIPANSVEVQAVYEKLSGGESDE